MIRNITINLILIKRQEQRDVGEGHPEGPTADAHGCAAPHDRRVELPRVLEDERLGGLEHGDAVDRVLMASEDQEIVGERKQRQSDGSLHL